MSRVRVRFAPSPTGFLHVGGLRTALFNYLFAKQNNGTLILRLEDTDRERYLPAGIDQIVESLDWLGLRPDEGFWINEGKQHNLDYIQSQRHQAGLYQKYADELIKSGLAYFSPTLPTTLEKLRAKSQTLKQPFLYRKSADSDNTDTKLVKVPIRLDVAAINQQLGHVVKWQDKIRGEFVDKLAIIEDFILIKSDGYPTYNFANVIDDHEMQISHVIRGDEFLSSTGKHALLFDVLNFKRPTWVHLPAINGTDGKKLSKRTGDTNVLDYKTKGYLPEALTNFLALLGWNDGTTKEVFSLEGLIKAFSLDRIQKSPAVFDPKRLDWLDGQYIRALSLDDLTKVSTPFWPALAKKADDSLKDRVLEVLQDRLKFLGELASLSHYFFEFNPPSKKAVDKLKADFGNTETNPTLKDWLQIVKAAIDKLNHNRASLEMDLKTLVQKQAGVKPATLWIALRLILANGADQTPPIWDIIYALGKNEAIQRLEAVRNML